MTIDSDIRDILNEKYGYGSASETASRFLRASGTATVCYQDESGGCNFGLVQYFLSLRNTTVAVITPLTATTEYCYSIQLRELQCSIIPIKKHS